MERNLGLYGRISTSKGGLKQHLAKEENKSETWAQQEVAKKERNQFQGEKIRSNYIWNNYEILNLWV